MITDLFKEMFPKEDIPETPPYRPVEIENPFTKEEIRKLVQKLKNNKSPGIDNVNGKLIKNDPEELLEIIAKILQLASTAQSF